MKEKEKYPVSELARYIEHDWAEELAAYYDRQVEDVTTQVRPWFDFPTGIVKIELMDGSSVEFRYAIFIVSEVRRAIAVFTEHCGHHLYPYHEARVFRDGELIYEQG